MASPHQYVGIDASQFNSNQPPSHPFASDVIFIAMDFEAYEHKHSEILDAGFAILDTRNLHKLAPGDRGTNWHPQIQYRHLGIIDYAHRLNKDLVDGCTGHFLFGQTEWIWKREAKAVIRSMFQIPDDRSDAGAFRNVVLVGHALHNDEKYLHRLLGVDVMGYGIIVDKIDTQVFIGGQRKLSVYLEQLGIPYGHLHNGGNDAAFAMQAVVSQLTLPRATWWRRWIWNPVLRQTWDARWLERNNATYERLKADAEAREKRKAYWWVLMAW